MTAASTGNHALLWFIVLVIRFERRRTAKGGGSGGRKVARMLQRGWHRGAVQCQGIKKWWRRGGQLLCVLLWPWQALLHACLHSSVEGRQSQHWQFVLLHVRGTSLSKTGGLVFGLPTWLQCGLTNQLCLSWLFV